MDLEPYDLTKIMKTNSIEFNTERQITVIHGANDGSTNRKIGPNLVLNSDLNLLRSSAILANEFQNELSFQWKVLPKEGANLYNEKYLGHGHKT